MYDIFFIIYVGSKTIERTRFFYDLPVFRIIKIGVRAQNVILWFVVNRIQCLITIVIVSFDPGFYEMPEKVLNNRTVGVQ